MDEKTNPPAPDDAPAPAPVTPAPDLSAELEHWKQLSQEHEQRWQETSRELEQAQEKARTAALAEMGTALVEAELRASAAAAGVAVPGHLDLPSFLGEDGRPDQDTISAFVESLPKPSTKIRGFDLAAVTEYRPGTSPMPTTMDPVELADLIEGRKRS
ncbi:hypothetical protein [Streptomyces sp. NPDC037389]|uniref:hypothetical protein n=1 Tax=Streptomyces sp. NPDC037389 TaxID=3155369 RepID=UPI00340C727D